MAAAPLVPDGPSVTSADAVAMSPAVGDSAVTTTSANAAPAEPATAAASTPVAVQPDVQVIQAAVAEPDGIGDETGVPLLGTSSAATAGALLLRSSGTPDAVTPSAAAPETIALWQIGATAQSWFSAVGSSTADTAGPREGPVADRPSVVQQAPAPAADSATSSRATDEALLAALPTLPTRVAAYSDGYDPLVALFGLDPLTLDLLARVHAKPM